jgi:hypothetical protein
MNFPVCSSVAFKPFLNLVNYPIYQHPVVVINVVQRLYTIDINYVVCSDCIHCYQLNYDTDILTNIYENLYYTPRPNEIGSEIHMEFIKLTKPLFDTIGDKPSVLEVGASCGETLLELRKYILHSTLSAVEPNGEACSVARSNGITTYNQFFNKGLVESIDRCFDVIFHRHVIEHIFDFKDFMGTTNSCSHSKTKLIIETPSLNSAVDDNRITSFHIEHVHVFSLESLSKIVGIYGWTVIEYFTTIHGNMIAIFEQKPDQTIETPVLPNDISGVQKTIDMMKNKVISSAEGKEMIVWGGGSGGRKIISLLGLNINYIVDSNINKIGRKFPGLPLVEIIIPQKLISDVLDGNEVDYVVIAASMYFKEIRKSLVDMGWNGDVISPYL